MPTLELALIINAGVALGNVCVVLGFQLLALTPVSTTKVPVVCIRMRSDAEDPLKTKNSCVPAPVEISAIAVLLYVPVKPKN
jgi:hypothetical protein